MPRSVLTLDQACDLVRTGDLWVFRGRSGADRAIRSMTNAPVNHVGMAIVLDDLPPMLWHAELGRALPDLWSGTRQRGVQLHDLRAAVLLWGERYGQRPWLRQLTGPVDVTHEDGALRAVARLDGTPFPSTARLAGRWLWGRVPSAPWRRDRAAAHDRGIDGIDDSEPAEGPTPASAYCAEVVALTYAEMGLLPSDRRPNWYDPGRFWSGDRLELSPGFRLGGEIAVELPQLPDTGDPDENATRDRTRIFRGIGRRIDPRRTGERVAAGLRTAVSRVQSAHHRKR